MSDDGSVPREVSSHDDGELSDESIHEKMVGESEEDRLRRRLLEKRERETREGPSGDDEEMFTIQPVDSQKPRLVDKDRERDREKERREREREKDRERQSSKHKHSDRRERDRHSHDDRHRAKYEVNVAFLRQFLDYLIIVKDRRLGKSIAHRGSGGRDHREKRTRSEKRERQEKERRIKRSLR
uniref:PRP4 pre-mRNA-processing factor 4 homolog n=1 Tax=Heterorhabditis bacteriophora TaxID=37862 RepID=A0A1I7XTT3_HETBA